MGICSRPTSLAAANRPSPRPLLSARYYCRYPAPPSLVLTDSPLGPLNHATPPSKKILTMHKFSAALLTLTLVFLAACGPSSAGAQPEATSATEPDSAPISVSGSYWIELSPVVVAANSFYPE